MYVSVRRYDGVDPGDAKEIVRRVDQGFVPIISKAPGFIAYYIVDVGEGVMASITIFEDQGGSEESNRMAVGYVKENLAPLLPNPPEITAGEVKLYKIA
jgi:hypothetical protein